MQVKDKGGKAVVGHHRLGSAGARRKGQNFDACPHVGHQVWLTFILQ